MFGRKKRQEDDETREYFEREDNDFNEIDDFDDEETQFDNLEKKQGFDWDNDEGDKTVLSSKKKKQEILGFIVVKKGNRKNDKFDLVQNDIIIGRNPKCCEIVLDDEDISKIHCRIRRDEDKNEFYFYDCGSTNGTTVNGEQIQHTVLKSHDKITLGESVEIIFIQV